MIAIEQSDTVRLTKREAEVLALIAEGLESQKVAERLSISKRTVDFFLSCIYGKLEVSNRIQAINRAQRLGLLGGVAV